MTIRIDQQSCDGCVRCLAACPYGGIDIADGKAVLNLRCTHCGTCLDACPQGAILSDAGTRRIPDFSEYRGVWVMAQQEAGGLHPVSLELLGKARELAEHLGQDVSALLLGDRVEPLVGALFAAGAQQVHLVEHPALAGYRTLPFSRAAAQVIQSQKPEILLVGATPMGRDLAPRLARRLGLGLTADCTGLEIDAQERILRQTRPAFGGNVMATIVGRYSRPQVATVRPGIMKPLPPEPGRQGRLLRHNVHIPSQDLRTTLLKTIQVPRSGVDLTSARVIVAGGRGVGNMAGFALLEELAGVLGAELGGTRVAYESGWIPHERQIGQTGVTVRPDLYVAVGLSGAIQHRAGMLDSRFIVAINKDRAAPIFDVADFALVGDFSKIVPAVISAAQEA